MSTDAHLESAREIVAYFRRFAPEAPGLLKAARTAEMWFDLVRHSDSISPSRLASLTDEINSLDVKDGSGVVDLQLRYRAWLSSVGNHK